MVLNSLNFKNGSFAIVTHLTGEINFAVSVDSFGIDNRNLFRIRLIIRITNIVGVSRNVACLSGSGFHFVPKGSRFCSRVSDDSECRPFCTRLLLVPTDTIIFSEVNGLVQTNLTSSVD